VRGTLVREEGFGRTLFHISFMEEPEVVQDHCGNCEKATARVTPSAWSGHTHTSFAFSVVTVRILQAIARVTPSAWNGHTSHSHSTHAICICIFVLFTFVTFVLCIHKSTIH